MYMHPFFVGKIVDVSEPIKVRGCAVTVDFDGENTSREKPKAVLRVGVSDILG